MQDVPGTARRTRNGCSVTSRRFQILSLDGGGYKGMFSAAVLAHLEETIGLSHRVLVMRDGIITHSTDASPGHKPKQLDLIAHMV